MWTWLLDDLSNSTVKFGEMFNFCYMVMYVTMEAMQKLKFITSIITFHIQCMHQPFYTRNFWAMITPYKIFCKWLYMNINIILKNKFYHGNHVATAPFIFIF